MRDSKPFIAYIIAGCIVFFLVAGWSILIFMGKGELHDKITITTTIMGAYGIAIGFISRLTALKPHRTTLNELTSPNILEYARANFIFLSFLPLFPYIATSSNRKETQNKFIARFGAKLWWIAGGVIIIYSFFHILVVAPLAYLPFIFASALIEGIKTSKEDASISVGQNIYTIKQIICQDEVSAKGFIVGVTAAAISLLTSLYGTMFGTIT